MSLFKDKVLLITGGTGSFGNAVLKSVFFPVMKRNKTICVIISRIRK